MNILSILGAVEAPSDLWVTLIEWVRGSVGNLGWTLILVTLLVKVVTTPLDFMVKLSTKKQTLVQQKCAPQVAKLQKKFGHDRQTLQVQTNSLYKREGLNMGAGCIIMLVNLILTMTIFFTFFGSLRKFSAYEAINQYEQVSASYEAGYFAGLSQASNGEFDSQADLDAWKVTMDERKAACEAMPETTDPEREAKQAEATAIATEEGRILDFQTKATDAGSKAAVAKWNDNKKSHSWLWIQNIWVQDSTTSPFPNYDSLVSMAKNSGYTDYVTTNINKDNYNKIAALIIDNSRSANGYYILAVLAGVITFLSQYITELHNKLKNKKAQILAKSAGPENTGSMKVMKIVMPAVMVIFVLTSTASFGLYILASNVASIALGEITTLIVDKMTKKKRLEVEEFLEKEANRLIRKGHIKE